jgi:hypothetical protein
VVLGAQPAPARGSAHLASDSASDHRTTSVDEYSSDNTRVLVLCVLRVSVCACALCVAWRVPRVLLVAAS